jgi:hypothetical protein
MRLRDSVNTDDIIAMFAHSQTPMDSALVDDNIRIGITKRAFDSATIDDFIKIRVTQKLTDVAYADDDILKIIFKVQADVVLIEDVIRVSIIKNVDSDSATIDDVIRVRLIKKLTDVVSVFDDITKIVFKFQAENVMIDDVIKVRLVKDMHDSATINDTIKKIVTYRPKDAISIQDDVFKLTFFFPSENVMIDDIIRITIIKYVFDLATVDDTIKKTVTYRPKDSVIIDDQISKVVTMRVRDDMATVEDILRPITIMYISDSAAVDDTIKKTVTYRPKDSISIQDDILKLSFLFPSDSVIIDDIIRLTILKDISDSATVHDTIKKTVTYRPKDSVIIDDQISKVVTMRVQDDMATVDDLITIAPATFRVRDLTSADDVIKKTVTYRPKDVVEVQENVKTRITKQIKDTVLTNDLTTWTLTRSVKDSISVNDFIKFQATLTSKDTSTTDDHITWTLTRAIKDTLSINDTTKTRIIQSVKDSASIDNAVRSMITKSVHDAMLIDEFINPMGAINIETRDGNGNLVQLANTYRIIPDPFTGTGSLLVTDGDPNDNDSVPNNGQINIFPVPLEFYRINQTVAPTGFVSLINFTFVTVHNTDINATALFPVVDKIKNLSVLNATKSDILDIANNRFDEIATANNLTRVRNGIHETISNVTSMPSPYFAGVNNSTAIVNAISSQYTLFYQNMTMPLNNIPEKIRIAFALAQYDAGNFTETTFVGVFAATGQFGNTQYLATIPIDKFNCGQQYMYSLDETLTPEFGGLSRADFSLDQNGVCPESEDYLTFEITSVPPVGIPTLSGEDILLYVNPQYPRNSITATGVNFGDSANIHSFNYTLISKLPKTNSTDDLTVYLQAGGEWSTTGVTLVSKQIILTGPNAGKVEIVVSVDHLAKMIVGGKKLPPPPPPPPIPFGQGRVLVGPSPGAGGVPDMPTARIHRVEYDVCNENIARILAAHDSSSPPRIQLLTTKLGVVDATLSTNQPFANQNQVTLIDRYLFEAPLARGETVFTIFAVDSHSNVQRTLVQVEGCEGTIVFADDEIVLPHIFDIKYKTNSTYVRPTEYSYITPGQTITISAIAESPIVPLAKAELFFTILGTGQQKVLPMTITPLRLPDLENVSVVSSMIPADLLNAPAIEFWIRIVTEEGVVQESVHSIVGIKPESYSGTSSVEMDIITIKAQGTTLKPTAYLTNKGDIPVYSDVSLVADGKKVYSKPVLLTPGQNIINIEWNIPKIGKSASYKMQTQLDVYDTSYITGITTLDTFVRTKIVSVSDQHTIVPATDELGNTIARPAMMYSSNEGSGAFRVTAPDGICVIGAGCLVEGSTLKHRGGIDSVLVDGHIYRVRYSGDDSPLERFSITSLDSVLGQWKVEIVQLENSEFLASAAGDIPIKVQYRAEDTSLITVGME